MARPGVILPILQNWSCHNCGGCCREHQIVITADEKKRIDRQKWTSADGVVSDRPLIVAHGKDFRLSHQADGACVFLDERGLCRIHSKFGEAAKPLACRTYPYAVHPAGNSVSVSLRFSCPSVVQNLGEAVSQQRPNLEQLATEIVPPDYTAPDGPTLCGSHAKLPWEEVTRLLAFVERGLSVGTNAFAVRLTRVLEWIDLLEITPAESLRGWQLKNLLPALHETAVRAIPDDNLPIVQPASIAKTMFRQWIAQLLRHDTELTARGGLMGRLRLLSDGVKFTFGQGRVPDIADPISVRVAFSRSDGNASHLSNAARLAMPIFSQLENEFSGRNAEFDELFVRYFRVKLQGMHFCGPAFYDMSFIDGFRSLALMYPATLWVARLRAARDGRRVISLPDVQAALATIDHNFGYSPALGMAAAKNRIKQLARMQQIPILCNWYSR